MAQDTPLVPHDHDHGHHEHVLRQELVCHFPYATLSVAISFIVLGLLEFMSAGLMLSGHQLQVSYHRLFHVMHYLHLLFATAGTVIACVRFSQGIVWSLIISFISPAVFCTLSDIALPTLAGKILGMNIGMHVCFFYSEGMVNIIPLMLIGLSTGYAIALHNDKTQLHMLSLRSHFAHILISSLAASSYVMSYGFCEWQNVMGFLFCMLVIAVVLPCTISDVVVPMYSARWRWGKHEKHTH
jgi:hypothetical protein